MKWEEVLSHKPTAEPQKWGEDYTAEEAEQLVVEAYENWINTWLKPNYDRLDIEHTLTLLNLKIADEKLEAILDHLKNLPEPLDCFDFFEISDWRDEGLKLLGVST